MSPRRGPLPKGAALGKPRGFVVCNSLGFRPFRPPPLYDRRFAQNMFSAFVWWLLKFSEIQAPPLRKKLGKPEGIWHAAMAGFSPERASAPYEGRFHRKISHFASRLFDAEFPRVEAFCPTNASFAARRLIGADMTGSTGLPLEEIKWARRRGFSRQLFAGFWPSKLDSGAHVGVLGGHATYAATRGVVGARTPQPRGGRPLFFHPDF